MTISPLGDSVPKRGNRFTQTVARSLLSLFGWRIEADVPDLPKFVMVGAPHTSNWDFLLTVATFYSLSVKISWMGKSSLFRRPFKGVMEWLGGVPVDRAGKREGIVEQTVKAFAGHEKFVIAVMPEGTRSKVAQWKTGFYHIAQEARVPIVLVRFDYGRKIMGIGPTIEPSGDPAEGVANIQSMFANIEGKNPRQV
jgi:1-acyl-sn-glycerol-3-phosphate acyltransferase